MRTWVMDDGELAVRLFYLNLRGGRLDAQSIVVGGIDNHIYSVCRRVYVMRCYGAIATLESSLVAA